MGLIFPGLRVGLVHETIRNWNPLGSLKLFSSFQWIASVKSFLDRREPFGFFTLTEICTLKGSRDEGREVICMGTCSGMCERRRIFLEGFRGADFFFPLLRFPVTGRVFPVFRFVLFRFIVFLEKIL